MSSYFFNILFNILLTKIQWGGKMENLGEKLKSARLFAGKKQKEVAEVLSCTTQCYSNYEKGKTEPNIDSLILIAKYFGVTLDELLGLESSRVQPIDHDQLFLLNFTRLKNSEKNRVLGYIDCLLNK